jgi:isocitrate/isopropylmalate dehydrogenase
MTNVSRITVARGDGIGPEIMNACLHVIQEAGVRIETEVIEIGEKVYLKGNSAGIEPSAWESLRRTDLLTIDNRGVKAWPDGMAETLCTDAYRRRFASKASTNAKQTVALLDRVLDPGVEIVKMETLRNFDGQPGYTLAQGQ